MPFFKEFRDFAVKGNVVDLAVGVVIGSAFGKIVTSFVNDIIMPLVTLITGKIDFSSLVIYLNGKSYESVSAAQEAGAPILYYGTFITNIVDFLIIALSIFIVIRQINKFKKKPEPKPITTKECPYCRSEIHVEATRCPHCTSELK